MTVPMIVTMTMIMAVVIIMFMIVVMIMRCPICQKGAALLGAMRMGVAMCIPMRVAMRIPMRVRMTMMSQYEEIEGIDHHTN